MNISSSKNHCLLCSNHVDFQTTELASLTFQPIQMSIHCLSFSIILWDSFLHQYFVFQLFDTSLNLFIFLILTQSLFENIQSSWKLVLISHNFRVKNVGSHVFWINFNSQFAIFHRFF